jgi:hypothetical protein
MCVYLYLRKCACSPRRIIFFYRLHRPNTMRIEQEDIQKKIQKNIKYQLFYSDKYLAIDSKKKNEKNSLQM